MMAILKIDMNHLKRKLLSFGLGWQPRSTRSLSHPSPRWGGEENGKKKAKLVGRDKGNLTEQQTKWTVTTTILIKRIHKTNSEMHRATLTTWYPARPRVVTAFPPASSPTSTQHGGTWCPTPCSVRTVWVSPPGCVPSWPLVKMNPGLAEPRTKVNHKGAMK